MNRVGSYYDNAVMAVDDPASTYWIAVLSQNIYVPPVTPNLGCWEIGANMKRLEDQILYWKKALIGPPVAVANAQYIVDVQQMKYDEYQARGLELRCGMGTQAGGEVPVNSGGDQPEPTGSGSNGMMWLLGAGALLLFFRSRTQTARRRRTR
jgi:hypothetical protein